MKKTLLLAATLLGITAASSFADALLFTVGATPYDNQMARIRPVLTASSRGPSNRVSLNIVNQWMGNLRSIPYGFTKIWKTPAEAQSGAPADCKAKAVALYEKMQANGATNVRLVIGKRTSSSRQTHAWLAWETEGASYVLDPTFNWTACATGKVGKRNYQPLYAYAGAKKFRAASTLVAQN
jgi:predicted transglutaminase-like cysteine proteinase